MNHELKSIAESSTFATRESRRPAFALVSGKWQPGSATGSLLTCPVPTAQTGSQGRPSRHRVTVSLTATVLGCWRPRAHHCSSSFITHDSSVNNFKLCGDWRVCDDGAAGEAALPALLPVGELESAAGEWRRLRKVCKEESTTNQR